MQSTWMGVGSSYPMVFRARATSWLTSWEPNQYASAFSMVTFATLSISLGADRLRPAFSERVFLFRSITSVILSALRSIFSAGTIFLRPALSARPLRSLVLWPVFPAFSVRLLALRLWFSDWPSGLRLELPLVPLPRRPELPERLVSVRPFPLRPPFLGEPDSPRSGLLGRASAFLDDSLERKTVSAISSI